MSAAQPLVLMMAGGTGGHVYPALAVATELLARGFRVEWVGTARGMESRVVPAAGITLHHLAVRGVRGKSLLHKMLGVAGLLLASAQALWLVLRRAPACVVGMGGYAAGPAGVAAWLLRKPLLIHEQNAVAGTTNRMLAPLASRVLAAFPGAFRGQQIFEVVGNPVRREMLDAAGSDYDYRGQRPLRLLVLGGSLGARPVNELLPPALELLAGADGELPLEVWHQTGEAHVAAVQQACARLPQSALRISPFIEDMAAAYTWADLVLCRAGALTVSELALMGRPALLVPLPHAIDDHQSANARVLADVGAGVLLPQSELDPRLLSSLLREYLEDPERLASMAAAAGEAARSDATRRVCAVCEELLHGH